MTSFVFIYKTETGNKRKIITVFGGFCEALESINDHLNACFYEWEILKSWKLS